ALFDPRCRTQTALEKLATLRRQLLRFPQEGATLKKRFSPTLEKALPFLDDKLLPSTPNAVERATGAIARCKGGTTGRKRKQRSACVWPWICGVKPTPKAGNNPSPHFIVHGLDKPGGLTTVSFRGGFYSCRRGCSPGG